MKKILSSLITFILIISLNIFLSHITNLDFIELSFFTGLISFSFIAFFSSEGGLSTSSSDMLFKRLLEKESRTNTHFFKLYMNKPLIVSIIYTLVSAIVSIYKYYPYFI